MKKFIVMLIAIFGILYSTQAQIKPSQMSTATVNAFKEKLGLNNAVNLRDSVYVKSQTDALLNAKAPLSSPALTGTPTAPTAASGTNTTQLATTAFVGNSESKYLEGFRALGFTGFKIFPIGMYALNSTITLTDNTALQVCFNVKETTTFSTVNFIMTTQGSYTADNYNGIGLYSLNLSTGDMTKITETADDGNIWKASANSIVSKSWPTQQTLSPGIYVIRGVYNSSAQTTAPVVLGLGLGVAGQLTPLFPNSIKMVGQKTGSNTLPSSEAMSSVSASTSMVAFWMN